MKESGAQPAELPNPERPVPPKWLKAKARRRFDELVDLAMQSGVPTKPADGHAFALAAQYSVDYEEAKDPSIRARLGRDLMPLLEAIGAHPKARMRMGIRDKKTGQSKTGQLLQLAKL